MEEENKVMYLVGIICLISVIGLMISVQTFWIGFHDADSGQNMRYLSADLGISLVDKTVYGDDFVTGEESYLEGIRAMIRSFWMVIFFSIMFSFSLASMLFLHIKMHSKKSN